MAAIDDAQATLDAYKAARDSILASKVSQVDINGKRYKVHELEKLEGMIDKYQAHVNALAGNGGFRKVQVIP